MKSSKELNEMRSLLCDTQFYYSEICISFSQLVSKKWHKPEQNILIPSVASETEIQEIEQKIEQIDVEIPNDDESSDSKSEIISQKSKTGEQFIPQKGRIKYQGRRVAIPWSKEEIDAIKKGIQKYGIGQWVKIRSLNQDIFAKNGRTAHDISDKFRTLKNKNEFKTFLKKYAH